MRNTILLCFFFSSFVFANSMLQDFVTNPEKLFENVKEVPEINLEKFQNLKNHMPYPSIDWHEATTLFTVLPTSTTTDVTKATSSRKSSAEETKKQLFVIFNYGHLKQEIAFGSGERLVLLSSLFGCPKSQSKNFGLALKNNYEAIFYNSQNITSVSFLNSVQHIVLANPFLSVICRR